ncbi:venom protease isoform X2 [Anabrus simplex]|uniref:venom protease isoform X2 n=1 Tax=Anabrus simplex TaxID=316456 RepID=UPI0035A314E8
MASRHYRVYLLWICWAVPVTVCQDNTCLWPETCQRISQCPHARQRLRDGLSINVCGFEEMQPTVCCSNGVVYGDGPSQTGSSRQGSTEENINTSTSSKSEEMCKLYGRSVFRVQEAVTDGAEPENASLCGLPEAVPLIVGGEKALPREFPHMAAVGYGRENHITWLCGGSLVSEWYVLTAAHCVDDTRPRSFGGLGRANWVRVGDFNLNSAADGVVPQQFRVVQWIIHPDYREPQKYNDIGLLRLDRKAVFTEYVRPACLHHWTSVPGGRAIATGWGQTSPTSNVSEILRKVSLPLVSQQYCNSKFTGSDSTSYRRSLPRGIVDTMLCAGERIGGKDTCQGDSGGPLQIVLDNPYCMYSIVGVTSFGRLCAQPDSPAVYTRVSSFIPWLEKILWP